MCYINQDRKDLLMKRLLVVVDYQNDFVDGALGFKGAELIAPAIARLINEFRANKDEVVFTYDTHDADYMNTVEGNNLPIPHCIKGSEGWQLYPLINDLSKDSKASIGLPNSLRRCPLLFNASGSNS